MLPPTHTWHENAPTYPYSPLSWGWPGTATIPTTHGLDFCVPGLLVELEMAKQCRIFLSQIDWSQDNAIGIGYFTFWRRNHLTHSSVL